jgi:hypothetical protein
MAYHTVPGEGLRTSYAYAPRVSVVTGLGGSAPAEVREGPSHLTLEFISSAITASPPRTARVTRLVFEHVIEYAWSDFEFHRDPYRLGVGALKLVEIDDSPVVADIRATGRFSGDRLQHFRITFDDHGRYDIVCERLTISHYDEPMPTT